MKGLVDRYLKAWKQHPKYKAVLILLLPSFAFAGLTEETQIHLQEMSPAFRQYLVRGWHEPDSGAAWTGKDKEDATIRIPVAEGLSYDVLLFPQVIPLDKFSDPYEAEILVNDKVIQTLTAEELLAMIEITVPRWALKADSVEVSLRCPLFSPKERGESPDDRWLGIKIQRVDILPWRREGLAMKRDERVVGIFCDADAPQKGASSDPHYLARLLRESQIPVEFLSAQDLASVSVLDPERMDLVLLPYGPVFPSGARNSFQRFLRRGGGFVSMGGYAFHHLYGEGFGEELLLNPCFDKGLASWGIHEGQEGVTMVYDEKTGRTRQGCARLSVEQEVPVTWYALAAEFPVPPTGSHVALDGYVRTENVREGAGAYAAVTFYDQNDRRITWMDTNQRIGTSPWTRIRGRVPVPEGTHQAALSLLLHGHGTAWFDDLHLRTVPPPLNTGGGRPADFLEVEPDQISVFDAGYPLEHVTSLAPAEGQTFFDRDAVLQGSLQGMAAVGMTGAQWYCTSQEKCRFLPILQAKDRFGRPRGPIGAVMWNYQGLYKGSVWAFFGVDNMDLFSAENPGLCQGLVRLVHALRSPLFLHETASDLACYRTGETVRLRTSLSNYGSEERNMVVRLSIVDTVTGEAVLTEDRRVKVAVRSTETVQTEWTPRAFDSDLYRIEAVLLDGKREIDREDTNGFVVWKEETIRQAPRLSLQKNVFQIGGRPLFMTGAQQFWASQSMRTCSPLTIARDFEDMRDFGVRIARSFMMWQLRSDHEERRFRDMMVYLAHRAGVVMYHEGTGAFPASSDDLAEERTRARYLAERYGDLPLFCVDHRNEPSLRLSEPLSSQWGDLNSYRRAREGADRLAEWSRELSREMHALRPDLLISVGFLQEGNNASVVKDPLWASEGLDFMNRHFYGPLRRFPSQFKEIDMRYRGVPPSTGEFGSRTHPAGGGNFESKEDQFTRYEFISHYALGLGGAFVCNWHWRDPWESIFSYGIFRQDHVPKDIAKVYRAIGLLLGSFRPVYKEPNVFVLLPDAHRLSYFPLNESLYRCLNAMINLRVEFGVIHEANLDELPQGCRAVLFPLPYLPAQETLDRLEGFVRKGGFLYLSGDLCYDDTDLKRSHPERLVKLCGATSDSPALEGLKKLGRAEDSIRPTGALPDLGAYQGRCRLTMTLQGAKAASEDGEGRPVAVVNGLGKGRVLFSADPVEVDEDALGESQIYNAFLSMAGIQGLHLSPSDVPHHCFEVHTQRGSAFVLYDRQEASRHEPFHMGLPKPFQEREIVPTRLHDSDLTLGLAPMKPGFAHIAADGSLLALESQGDVLYRGTKVLETDTHCIVVSLDGKDLRQSESLLFVALYPGRVRLFTEKEALRGILGQLRGGRWHSLTDQPLTQDGESLTMTTTDDSSLEIILIGTDLAGTKRRLETLAGF